MRNTSSRLQRLMLIQPGEAGKVGYFLVFFLLVSAGMAIGNSTANALFLKRVGVEYLPLLYMGQSVLLAVVSLGYAAIADRVPAERFFRYMFSTLLLLVAGCWLLVSYTRSSLVYPAYYLVYEVASEVLLVHAALYLGQNMNTLQVKRLAPLMFAGAQVGTITGGSLLALVAPLAGAGNLLLIWCLLLSAAVALLIVWHRRHGQSSHYRAPRKSRDLLGGSIEQVRQGVRFTLDSSLLRAASMATFCMVIAFYIMTYSINRIYNQAFAGEAELAGFLGALTAVTGSIALLLQLFVTSRVIRRFGVRRINMLFPVSTTLVLSALAISFTLPAALLGSLNRDTIMTAFRNPVRTMFFNVLPAYMQGRARALIVAIVLPLALFICGLLLWFMQHTEDPVIFIAPGILAGCLYIWFNLRMNRAYVTALTNSLRERLFLPDENMYRELGGSDERGMEDIEHGVRHPDPAIALSYARALLAAFPEQAAGILVARAATADHATADRLLALLDKTDLSPYVSQLQALASSGDAHLQATVFSLLAAAGGREQRSGVMRHLQGDNPRLCANAIHICLQETPGTLPADEVISAWSRLLGGNMHSLLAALELVPDLACLPLAAREKLESAYIPVMDRLFRDGPDGVRIQALRCLYTWPSAAGPVMISWFAQYLDSDNPEVRVAAARCLQLADGDHRAALLQHALADGHARVRAAALDCLVRTDAGFPGIVADWVLGNQVSLRAQETLLAAPQAATLDEPVFKEIALIKAREAERLQQAVHYLQTDARDDQSASRRLLEHVLNERFEQTVQLALLSLRSLHEPGLIEVIRAGFASGDERFIANASEALSTIADREAPGLLHKLLMNRIEDSARHDGGMFTSIRELLDWCAGLQGELLQTCVSHIRQETELEHVYDRPD